MNKKSSITLLIVVVVCVLLQFLTNFTLFDIHISFFAAAFLIFIPPFFSGSGANAIEDERSNGETCEKWRTVQLDECHDLFQRMKTERVNVVDLKWYDKIYAFFVSLGMLIFAAVISFFVLCSGDYILGSLILDIIAVPRALFIIIYDGTPHAVKHGKLATEGLDKKLKCVEDLIDSCSSFSEGFVVQKISKSSMELQPQLKITKSGKCYSFSDIRLNVVPEDKIENLLCSMISISENSVRDVKYPYAYGVFVFKGTEMNADKSLSMAINDILQSSSSQFVLEDKAEEGNSLYVILKRGGACEYHTNTFDCQELAIIMKKLCELFAK